ncbi:putative glucan endo-1,3-beta-glucosidase btgC [Zancudomyces culisetae]|uniref:glucan endo-1,3-beta-D-glucosidase n=1 Tax=Zancudomyces culisetae TaxID=1213189 RepID=A0A1R1PDS0_ZANCU|nr:putative glucan endo-1,3-beta-glucosidase btgC [Zancudomyces culisetae]OMH80239.1 putative glucan endo-1,3-beta-glucosidase btgC [Zancudomyces culisetae]|eukprot:OMH79053.1 putative glucan endo-1,3-beta-glucosidase btgC [Zancudomyces culisetae]
MRIVNKVSLVLGALTSLAVSAPIDLSGAVKQHNKRDVVVVTNYVYVDEMSHEQQSADLAPAPAPSAEVPQYAPSANPEQQVETVVSLAPESAPESVPAQESAPSSTPAPATLSNDRVFSGLTYSPYQSDGSCGTYESVAADLIKVGQITGNIRIYSTDCSQLDYITQAITQNNLSLKVHAGIWTSNGSDRVSSETADLIRVLSNPANRNVIADVSVGNEEIYKGAMDEATLIGYINSVRSALRQNGYSLPVYTTEIDSLYSSNLIEASDLVQANIHSCFGGDNVSPKDLATLTVNRYNALKARAGSKYVRIGETGFPSSGQTSNCQGSIENQDAYTASFVCQARANNIDYFYFEAKDSLWKVNAPSYERSYGVLNSDASAKINLGFLGQC